MKNEQGRPAFSNRSSRHLIHGVRHKSDIVTISAVRNMDDARINPECACASSEFEERLHTIAQHAGLSADQIDVLLNERSIDAESRDKLLTACTPQDQRDLVDLVSMIGQPQLARA